MHATLNRGPNPALRRRAPVPGPEQYCRRSAKAADAANGVGCIQLRPEALSINMRIGLIGLPMAAPKELGNSPRFPSARNSRQGSSPDIAGAHPLRNNKAERDGRAAS